MSSRPNENCWGLIIQTNEYSGNFERELCAHCTGQTGECGVGDEFVTDEASNMFVYNEEEDEDLEIIMSVADDHGCFVQPQFGPAMVVNMMQL